MPYKNIYIDVRGAHPILVFGVQTVTLEGIHRGITIDGLKHLVDFELSIADLPSVVHALPLDKLEQLKTLFDAAL